MSETPYFMPTKFDDYWDSIIDANEAAFSVNPGLANAMYDAALNAWELQQKKIDELKAKLNVIEDAIRWERECCLCRLWIRHEIQAELKEVYDTREIELICDCAEHNVDNLVRENNEKI